MASASNRQMKRRNDMPARSAIREITASYQRTWSADERRRRAGFARLLQDVLLAAQSRLAD